MKWLTFICCLFWIAATSQEAIDIPPESLGYQVNSEAIERQPLISVDGQRLFFIRSAHPQNIGPDNLDDIWMTYFDTAEGWTRAVNLGGPLNNRQDNAVIGIDPSGEMLYLKNNYKNGKNGGVAISYLKKRNWSKPQPMSIDSFYNLSTVEDFSVGINGGILLMSIEQQGGLGQRDLYFSFRKNEHSWHAPVHMGNTLNTVGEEAGVYLAPDGKTLFFSSTGHGGFGGLDLFVSKRLDNTWTNWSIPQNLGQSICSSDDDYYISVPVNSEFAYYSKRDSSGNYQIFQAQLPDSKLPEPVMIVSGELIDGATQTTKGANLTFKHFNYPENFTSYIRQDDGTYKLVLPYGEDMALHAEAEGYFAVSEYFELSKDGLEEEDLDPANMLAAVNLDGNYIQRDEEISNLQLEIRTLNGELQDLNDQREAYKEKLLEERAKLNEQEFSYLRTDPELEALRHRYNNFLNQANDTIPTQPKEEFTSRGIPQSYDQQMEEYDELAEMKARFNKHYKKDTQNQENEEEDELYLWDEAMGFDDMQKDVEKELKKELVPIVTQELQRELIDDVKKDLERLLDKESLKSASQKVTQKPILEVKPHIPDEFNQESFIKTDLRQTMQPHLKNQIKSELADEVRDVLKYELAYQAKKDKEDALQKELDNKVYAQIRHEEQTPPSSSNIPKSLFVETRTTPAPVYKEVQQDLLLLPIKEAQIIPLNNIFFNPNSAILKPTSHAELDRVANFLMDHPTAVVEFGGHTNGWASHSFATKLSTNRALKVVDFLIEKGVNPQQMKAKGYGKTMPIATNDTVEGRKQNQRIEMKIISL